MSHSRLRSVELPPSTNGHLYLSAMPGRCESLQDILSEAKNCCITRIACLAGYTEIKQKSPDYAEALHNNKIPWPVESFPIADFGVPNNQDRFSEFVHRLATHLRSGEHILLHCGAGIGRIGMVATCLLLSLGLPKQEAEGKVRLSGSGAENREQQAFIDSFAKRMLAEGQRKPRT